MNITINLGGNKPQPAAASMDEVRRAVIRFLQANGINTPLGGYIKIEGDQILVAPSYANRDFATALCMLQLAFSGVSGCDINVAYIEYRPERECAFIITVKNTTAVVEYLNRIGRVKIKIN